MLASLARSSGISAGPRECRRRRPSGRTPPVARSRTPDDREPSPTLRVVDRVDRRPRRQRRRLGRDEGPRPGSPGWPGGRASAFHKVSIRPGKPLWFGVGPRRGDPRPGLPVLRPAARATRSPGLVLHFLLFVRPRPRGAWPVMLAQTRPAVRPRPFSGSPLPAPRRPPTYHSGELVDGRSDPARSSRLRRPPGRRALADGFSRLSRRVTGLSRKVRRSVSLPLQLR